MVVCGRGSVLYCFFFFFQAEDGIRDLTVTGVQTCALPIWNGFHEDLTVLNHGAEPIDLDVRVEAASDFADLFEVKDALAKKGEYYHRIESSRLVLGYRRERFVRETWISASAPPEIDERGLSYRLHLEPHSEWSTCLDVVAAVDGTGETHTSTKYGHGDD